MGVEGTRACRPTGAGMLPKIGLVSPRGGGVKPPEPPLDPPLVGYIGIMLELLLESS